MSINIIKSDLLNSDQYYHQRTDKSRIILHHTAGGTAESSIRWWNTNPDHVCTPYLIKRDGTILEVFNPEYWAYALGLGSRSEEKKSIQIEICNYGGLIKQNGELFREVNNKLYKFNGEFVEYSELHRGFLYFEKYTDQQINSVVQLIRYLSDRFEIEINDVEKFWWYDRSSEKTLISHTTLRRGKSDIHPQPNLIKAIYDYANCDAPITE